MGAMARSATLPPGPVTRRRIASILLSLVAAVQVWLPAGAGAAERADPCNVRGVERVVAVGDVHGADERFLAILRAAGIVDGRGRWAGGRAHLVQTGDVVDRGPGSRKVIDLLRRLEGEARKAGGRVHALLGNHEAMWMLGDLRYVSPAEYDSFRTGSSEQTRDRLYEAVSEQRRAQAEAAGEEFDEKAFRERFLAELPLGAIELRREMAADGRYGRWLRGLPTVVRIDGVMFLHGGLSPEVAPLGCAGINQAVRKELAGDLDQIRATPAEALVTREDGPLWYRGLAQNDESAFAPQLEGLLRAAGARALVVGHTVAPGGKITPRFGGRVILLDTGMQPAYVPDGRAAALEIEDGRFTAIYEDGREVLGSVPGEPAPASPSPVPAPR